MSKLWFGMTSTTAQTSTNYFLEGVLVATGLQLPQTQLRWRTSILLYICQQHGAQGFVAANRQLRELRACEDDCTLLC